MLDFNNTDYAYDLQYLEGNEITSITILDTRGNLHEYSLNDLSRMKDEEIRALIN